MNLGFFLNTCETAELFAYQLVPLANEDTRPVNADYTTSPRVQQLFGAAADTGQAPAQDL
jgi:hypothetical protein